MVLNCPLGAFNCPNLFEPQQRMAPSVRNPHEYLSPEEMAVKRVSGGSASPGGVGRKDRLRAQRQRCAGQPRADLGIGREEAPYRQEPFAPVAVRLTLLEGELDSPVGVASSGYTHLQLGLRR